MKAQHLHHKTVARAILNSVDPENFVPKNLGAKILSDDSCWEEYESEYAEESLPCHVRAFFEDSAYE